ncbi:MerR family transcriptional regulator [Prescottella equi]
MRDGGEHMQIGEVAERTELSIRTVRHYDEVGLVTPSARSAGGFRLYTEADVQRLLVIRRMKPLKFTLAEMKELLESVEVLDDPAASDNARAEALDAVRRCHARAEESCDRLRRHLAYAQELTGLLAERSAAPSAARG